MSAEGGLQRQFYEMLMESQWWSADQLRNYQRSQLAQLLRHAKAQVPFYEHRLDAVVKPNGDIDWDRWSEIPIVKRQDMIDHREMMQARELPPGHGPTAVFETSGSTGEPIAVTSNSLMTTANNGVRWRCHEWNSLDWGKNLCIRDGSNPSKATAPDGTFAGPWGPQWDVYSQTGQAWVINKLASAEEVLTFLQAHNCAYLNTGPKTATAYANEARRLHLQLSIEAFLCQGGAVDPEDREIAQDVFGAILIEHYSSREAGQMATMCKDGNLHVNSECVFLELLDDNGEPASSGKNGRVVITPIFSTAQPLIRYEQGDTAQWGSVCTCGVSHPVLRSVSGRQLATFYHPDGRSAAQILPPAAKRALGCIYLQVAQIDAHVFEARYVPMSDQTVADEAAFTQLFRLTFFSDAVVVFRRLDEIPFAEHGKTREYVNEWTTA